MSGDRSFKIAEWLKPCFNFAIVYLQNIIPLLDAFATLIICIGANLNPFLCALVTGLSIYAIFNVSKTNVIRRMNNIRTRSSLLDFKLIPSSFDNVDMSKQNLTICFLMFLAVCSGLIFAIFNYQSYYYACYIYLRFFSISPTASLLTFISYVAVLPAAVFSVFSHISDLMSTYRRFIRLYEKIIESSGEVTKYQYTFMLSISCLFVFIFSFNFSGFNFNNLLYKHVNFLSLVPDSNFACLTFLLSPLYFSLCCIELLRGFNFISLLEDVYSGWQAENLNDISDEDTRFCYSVIAVSLLKAYNVSKINYTNKSILVFIPTIANNVSDNVLPHVIKSKHDNPTPTAKNN